MSKDYSQHEREDLLKIIEKLESKKKYGLIWDEEKTKEQFERESENALPVLEEITDKKIETNTSDACNIFIEGDNYHALSVLNYTHQGRIDVIYIDPPYNTGEDKEWKFNDNWVDRNDSYRHSKWLSFMSKRLRLAKNLLKEEGVIFISIDDNEYAQLKLLCDAIFGEDQFIASLVWEKKKKGSHLDGSITNVKEYVIAYSRNYARFAGLIGEINEDSETYPCINPGNTPSIRTIPAGTKSNYREGDVNLPKNHVISVGTMKLTLASPLKIQNKRLVKDVQIKAEWRYDQDGINEFAKKDELYFTQDLYLRRVVSEPRHKRLKDLLLRTSGSAADDSIDALADELKQSEVNMEKVKGIVQSALAARETGYDSPIDPKNLYLDGWGSNEDGDNEQRDFFGEKVFNYPKPSKLIEKLIASTGITNGIVLDFFAGSGTTAHAVRKLAAKGRNLQFILCTNNEDNDEGGMKVATDICYPRIQKVISGYTNREKAKVPGLGGNLRYFKTSFVKNSMSRDTLKMNIVQKCTEMLCLREGVFSQTKAHADYRIFQDKDRILAMYNALERDSLETLRKELEKMKGEKTLYCFTLDPLGLDMNDFTDWKNVRLEPIPQTILDIYDHVYEY